MSYKIINNKIYSLGVDNVLNNSFKNQLSKSSFKDVLKREIECRTSEFKISNHAKERLRFITLESNDYEKLEYGLKKAREKGSKNTLMLYKNMAFVMSVENNTLITVVEEARARENIFTNIDSLVIL